MADRAALSWVRQVVGTPGKAEFPKLEALLEANVGQPHGDYRILARVVPPAIAILGCAISVQLYLIQNPLLVYIATGFEALAVGAWIVFDRLDKRISPTTRRLRKAADEVWDQHRRLFSLAGICPEVGRVLDEAAGIYLRRQAREVAQPTRQRAKAMQALEGAMARLLDLANPKPGLDQETVLAEGWAIPLLEEMRTLDRTLDHLGPSSLMDQESPLAKLREARLELQHFDAATNELNGHLDETAFS